MAFKLYDHQEKALGLLKPGSILFGKVGSGKTLTSLVYYTREFSNRKLYVITTAKKRNTGDWEEEAKLVGITDIVVDSWNNIGKYTDVRDAFFIFDEQRVVGYGKWSKSFIDISRKNRWILLSGTPGDTWSDYIPVFIANGFYRNKTDFSEKHIEYDRFSKYPKIKAYHNTGYLMKLRQSILVPMQIERHTKKNTHIVPVKFNKDVYNDVLKSRWNPFTNAPIETPSELTQVLRRVLATHHDRIWHAKWIMDTNDRVIVFYNYNYELDILLEVAEKTGKTVAQYNGHKHDDLPTGDKWIYILQYTAGAEGWNCITTNVILFYSLNYSYKIKEQAEGRIDRLNTPYTDLNYYYLVSKSSLDRTIQKAVQEKKAFNESLWSKEVYKGWGN